MLLDVLIVSIVITLLFGHKLSNLKDLKLKWIELFILGFLIQLAIVWLSFKNVSFVEKYHFALHILSFLLLFIGIYKNLHVPGFKWIGVGVALNFLVIFANNGQMPVSGIGLEKIGLSGYKEILQSGKYLTHTLIGKGTHLPFLADRFYIPHPYPRPTLFSIGDVFIGIGLFILIFKGSMSKEKEG